MGYSPWGHKELDIPEATQHVHMHNQKTCENCHHLLAQGNANQDYSERLFCTNLARNKHKSLTIPNIREHGKPLHLFFLVFICLAALGLSCRMQDLSSSLQDVGALVVACKLLVVVYEIYFPDQRSNLGPLHREPRVVATGPPGKFPLLYFL